MFYSVESKKSDKLFQTNDLKEAVKFYNKTSKANLIQIYTSSSYKTTAGVLQPNVPKSIVSKGKTFKRAYMGFHTKSEAEKITKGFSKNVSCIIKKYKQGYQVFVAM
jgi:hypothetical protein